MYWSPGISLLLLLSLKASGSDTNTARQFNGGGGGGGAGGGGGGGAGAGGGDGVVMTEGAVRLADSPMRGRVEILHNDRWGKLLWIQFIYKTQQ